MHFFKPGILLALLLIAGGYCLAQSPESKAREYAAAKDYDKAVQAYNEAYSRAPDSFYSEYLGTLLDARKYKDALKLVEKQMSLRLNPLLQVDLGRVYAAEGKQDAATQQFDSLVKRVNGDDLFTQKIVKAFTDAGLDDYAIMTYERAGQLLNTNYYYSTPLAMLYAKKGNLEKAIDLIITGNPGQYMYVDNIKTLLLQLLGDDPEKLKQAQKILVKKINEQPANVFLAELLTWIYTQKNDWDGALIQMEAIDERNKEGGKRLMDLARLASAAGQWDVAVRAYDDILVQGKELPYYILSRSERLGARFSMIKANPNYTAGDVKSLAGQYDTFLLDYPKYYGMQLASDYAMLLAQYGNDAGKAIEVLQKGIAEPDAHRDMVGRFKLQLGDYYVLEGKIWEASLVYSQVDKEFRQDALGEDARFRNSRLAYYRGDFDWAQKQLGILKASTSELIANDAIYLSVLITENVEDSNMAPLQRFAYAGLLMFQNKDSEAEALLDSISTTYPEHPLNDDILMAKADLARKHRNFDTALAYLKTIMDKYGSDVLGDDAEFKTAEIYQQEKHQNDQARHYYEQLIMDFPGSTYVQTARQRLAELNKGTTP